MHFPIEDDCFYINPNTFCGLDCYLITPQMNAKWSNDNLFYRSLIIDKEGNVLSSGWPKFFNYGEKPGCCPSLDEHNDWRFVDKVDGTLVICDYINNQFSMRTRGTVTYATQNNAPDFELLPQKYPKVVEFLKENPHITLLFELVTPNNVIVVRPKEVDFYLLGAINKDNMTVVTSSEMTDIWRQVGPIQTPQTFTFSSTTKLSEIAQHIKNWRDKEGIVISYNNNQNRIKLKSDWYLFCHRVKSQLSSTNNLIEFYVEKGMPSAEDLYAAIETEFDYEIALQLKSEIKKICEVGHKVKKDIENMKDFVSSIRKFETRKQQAEHINNTYGVSGKTSQVFYLLDNEKLSDCLLQKLFDQNLRSISEF